MKSAPLKPRNSKTNRLLLLLALSPVVGVPLAHFLWGVWAERHLNQTLAQLHDAGEPVTSEQLVLNSVPDAQNASLDYKAAGDAIDPKTAAWRPVDESLNRDFQPPLTDNERRTVSAILSEDKAALSLAVAARGKSAGAWVKLGASDSLSPFPSLAPIRQLCNLLRLAAMDAHAAGDEQQAVDRLGDMLSEADAAEHRPTLVGHLVAIGCTAMASEAIGRMASDLRINSNGLSREQVTELLGQLQNEQAMNDGSKLSWRSERLFGLGVLQGGLSGAAPLLAPSLGPTPTPAAQANLIKLGYLIKPLVLSDTRLYAEHLQDIMMACTAPDWPAARRQMPTKLPLMVQSHPYIHLLLYMILPGFDKAAMADYHAKADRRLAAVAIAVRLYAADHNDRLPAALADLVPAYLPAIPIDPMSGSPLKFKSDPPRVYSVGDDGVDDGGVPVDPTATGSTASMAILLSFSSPSRGSDIEMRARAEQKTSTTDFTDDTDEKTT